MSAAPGPAFGVRLGPDYFVVESWHCIDAGYSLVGFSARLDRGGGSLGDLPKGPVLNQLSHRFVWIVAALGAASAAFAAVAEVQPAAPAAVEDQDEAEGVREHVSNLVKDAVHAYLQSMGIRRRERLHVVVEPRLGASAMVESTQVQIVITTEIEHPDQIGREARQAVQRALVEDGYRFPSAGSDPGDLAPDDAARPTAQLTLTIEYPEGVRGWRDRVAMKPVLVLTSIVLMMLGGLYLCWMMLLKLARSFGAPAATAESSTSDSDGARPGPGLQQPYVGAASFPPDGLPPLPTGGLAMFGGPHVDIAPAARWSAGPGRVVAPAGAAGGRRAARLCSGGGWRKRGNDAALGGDTAGATAVGGAA